MRLSNKYIGWISLPFMIWCIGAVIIVLWKINVPLFLAINNLSAYTGTWFWANITLFGDTLVFVVLFLPFIRKYPQLIYAMLIALIMSTLLVQIPKHILDIPRPPALLEKENIIIIGPAYSYNAFPSGHSASVFCLYILFLQIIRSQTGKLLLLTFCFMVVISRIVVGIHWPLDAAAGAVIGIFSGYIAVNIIKRYVTIIPDMGHLVVSTLLMASALVLLVPYHSYYDQAFWLQRMIAAICLAVGIPEYIKLIQHHKSKREIGI